MNLEGYHEINLRTYMYILLMPLIERKLNGGSQKTAMFVVTSKIVCIDRSGRAAAAAGELVIIQ